MNNKIYIHWNLPRQILRDAAKSKNFNLTVFKKSAHIQALEDGFIENNVDPIFNFRMQYFLILIGFIHQNITNIFFTHIILFLGF